MADGGDLHRSGPAAPAAPAPAPERGAQPAENPRSRGHSPARDQREQAPVPAERKISVGSGEYSKQQITEALAHKVEHDTRRAALPQNPAGYEVKFNDGFVQPLGVEFKFCEENPDHRYGLGAAKQFALKHGLDQAAFSELLELHAATQFEGIRSRDDFVKGEVKKLGSAASERVSAVHRWFIGRLGEAHARDMMAGLVTARQVEGFEKLMQAFSDQGAAAYRQDGRNTEMPKPHIPSMQNGATYAQVRSVQDAINQRDAVAEHVARHRK